ncbi:MAG: hemerythrin domain-containing protein [Deltaproteobacteria bacterium]|nr:hemerythrin domain-containing protein [Deltaproteobacteria bacterium]
MDIIELITADHDEAAKLIEELDQFAADDSRTSEAMRIAVKLAVALKTHAKAEERILYESMRTATAQLAEFALEGPYEHQALDLMLDKLAVHRPGPELRAILHVIKAQFEHHARVEEEGVMLPAVREAFRDHERAQLARDFLDVKERLQPQIVRQVGAPARGTHDGRGFHIHGHRR